MIFSGVVWYCRKGISKQIFSLSSRGRGEAQLLPRDELQSRRVIRSKEGQLLKIMVIEDTSKVRSGEWPQARLSCVSYLNIMLPSSPSPRKNPKLLESCTCPARSAPMALRRPHRTRLEASTKSHQDIIPSSPPSCMSCP